MSRIISILAVYLMLIFVFQEACEAPEEEVVSDKIKVEAGFSEFMAEIEPVMNESESIKRTKSSLEIINTTEKEDNDEAAIQKDIKQSDIDLVATLVRAEAGNQPPDGKRAVAAVVFNRVDSDNFPNTISDVIYQKGQFECISDGNFDKALKTKDKTDYQAVELELNDRTNNSWVYFRTGHYSKYGTPACQIGDHYFSKETTDGNNKNEENQDNN